MAVYVEKGGKFSAFSSCWSRVLAARGSSGCEQHILRYHTCYITANCEKNYAVTLDSTTSFFAQKPSATSKESQTPYQNVGNIRKAKRSDNDNTEREKGFDAGLPVSAEVSD